MKSFTIFVLANLILGYFCARSVAAPSLPLSLSLSTEDDEKLEDIAWNGADSTTGEEDLAVILRNAGNPPNPLRSVTKERRTNRLPEVIPKELTSNSVAKTATRIIEDGAKSSIAVAGGLANIATSPFRIAGNLALLTLELLIRGILLFLRAIGYPLTLAARSANDVISIVPSVIELARNITRATFELSGITRSPFYGVDASKLALRDILDPVNLFGRLTHYLRNDVSQATRDAISLALGPLFPPPVQRALSPLDSTLRSAIRKIPDSLTPLLHEFKDAYQRPAKVLGYA